MVTAAAGGLDFPYSSLDGYEFERLCFHLLLVQGKKPRYFGERGQAQFGIDLIISDGGRCEVYQCKNVAGYDEKNLKRDLEKFEREWLLGRPDLILPKKFTLCVPERLQGRDEWERAKSFFVSRWHIPVEEWDRNILDPWLREQPDIVADLFGDAFAETYCRQDNWNDGRFRPLLSGSGDGRIDRFLSLREDRAIVIPEAFREKFSEVLGGSSTVLIEELPGVGKTTTALALGSAAGRRVFFVGIDDGIDENALFEGVKRRCARETTFVIDDCQNNWSLVARAMRRWRRALGGRDYRLVLTAQTAPEGTETYDLGAIDLLTALRDDGVSIEVVADETLFRSVLAKRKSALAFAPDDEIVYLYGLTGGSLAVLDLIVESGVETIPRDATIESIAPKLVGHWFPTESPTAPRLRDFAAVAQFDIAIPALASWPEPEGSRYRSAIRRLVGRFADARRGVPPSWRFLHPAAAESIFRALCAVALEDWHIESVRAVVEHFRERAQPELEIQFRPRPVSRQSPPTVERRRVQGDGPCGGGLPRSCSSACGVPVAFALVPHDFPHAGQSRRPRLRGMGTWAAQADPGRPGGR